MSKEVGRSLNGSGQWGRPSAFS